MMMTMAAAAAATTIAPMAMGTTGAMAALDASQHDAPSAMAAAAAVNQLQFLFQQLIYATGAGMVIHGMRRKMSEHTGTTMATPADTAMNSGSPSGDTMPYSRA